MWQENDEAWLFCHWLAGESGRRIRASGAHRPVGKHPLPVASSKGPAMELFLVLFILLITAVSAAGLGADSRDSADWQPSVGGMRRPPTA